jgi:DNA-binding NarL/FixJ family response regulator
MRRVAVLGDDGSLVRSLVLAASSAPDNVVQASTGATIAGLARLLDALPDVLIIDESSSSWELVHRLGLLRPDLRVVVVVNDAGTGALAALSAGASGVLLAESAAASLPAALDAIGHGLYVMPRAVLEGLLAERPALRDLAGVERLERLTPREREVLAHLMAGEGHREIAEALVLSVHTVRFHMKQILAKLGVHSGLEAAMLGARGGVAPAHGRPPPQAVGGGNDFSGRAVVEQW